MIIDARCRPPTEEFHAAFMKRKQDSRYLVGPGTNPPSFVSGSIDDMFREMDEAGIARGVVAARIRPTFEVHNDGIAEVINKYPDRLIGVAGIDPWGEYHQPVPEIERSIRQLNLKGISIEPSGLRRPMHFDDPRLYPIYAKCDELDVPVFITTGPMVGPTLDYTRPEHIEPVVQYFPNLKIMLIHGCYPFITEMIAVSIRRPNVFFSSDLYTFYPGGDLYMKAADHEIGGISSQLLFATAYPLASITESTKAALKFNLRKEAADRVFYQNAERLLGL